MIPAERSQKRASRSQSQSRAVWGRSGRVYRAVRCDDPGPARAPRLEESVRVQADQVSDDELQLALLPPSPPGASLTSLGSKAYTLTWCPQSSELTAQSAFPFRLQASTVRGFPPIDKSYLVRVRTETADSCLLSPISHRRLTDHIGVANALSVEVTDDIGIKSAPTISYQQRGTTEPDGAWDTLLMTRRRLRRMTPVSV